jgi:hypothetical protein
VAANECGPTENIGLDTKNRILACLQVTIWPLIGQQEISGGHFENSCNLLKRPMPACRTDDSLCIGPTASKKSVLQNSQGGGRVSVSGQWTTSKETVI